MVDGILLGFLFVLAIPFSNRNSFRPMNPITPGDNSSSSWAERAVFKREGARKRGGGKARSIISRGRKFILSRIPFPRELSIHRGIEASMNSLDFPKESELMELASLSRHPRPPPSSAATSRYRAKNNFGPSTDFVVAFHAFKVIFCRSKSK